ncbi:MAG: N-6 DNA methylase [Candidatus Nomurabacteria bacterium]
MKNKKEILGQFFTKQETVKKVLGILFEYVDNSKKLSILEPSSGTGNFIKILNELGYKNITGCEIDPELTDKPEDFFDMDLNKKFDLIVGNPPFTKYNLKDSYYYASKYKKSEISPNEYLSKQDIKIDKHKIENVFINKSIKHLKSDKSSIGFVLPISFFIKKKNLETKKNIVENFSSVIIYQDDSVWFDRNIPCCFAIFTNNKDFEGRVVVIYKNSTDEHIENLELSSFLDEELIPQVIYNKKSGKLKNEKGISLSEYLSDDRVVVKKSFTENNISAKNILELSKTKDQNISDYKLAVVRVGNSSVGKSGLINIKKDTLNDMFFVFDFKDKYKNNKEIKEKITNLINSRHEYFRNITCRVGSKSIKKSDILEMKIEI